MPEASSVAPPRNARDDAAKAAGVSPRSVQTAKAVAKANPELAQQVKVGTLSLQLEASRRPGPANRGAAVFFNDFRFLEYF